MMNIIYDRVFNNMLTINSLEVIKPEMYEWHGRKIKPRSVLVWDLENIPFKRLAEIKELIKYTPQDLYVITKQKLSTKTRAKIEKEQFKILDAHKTISDTKIISIMKLYRERPNIILISSDSDFVHEATKCMENSHLHWIMLDDVKKRILMKINLAHKNLTISTLKKVCRKKPKDTESSDIALKKIWADYIIKELNVADPKQYCSELAPSALQGLICAYDKRDKYYTFLLNSSSEIDEIYQYIRFVYVVIFTGNKKFISFIKKASIGHLDINRIKDGLTYQDVSMYIKSKQ